MLILEKYKQSAVAPLLANNDSDYLELQVWQLQNLFFNEISVIKNTLLEHIAFSKLYAESFGCNESTLGKQESIFTNEAINKKITTYERQILKNRGVRDFVYQVKQDKEVNFYLMRVRALVNPTTDNCVGVLTLAVKVDFTAYSKVIYKKFLDKQIQSHVISADEITEQQHQIIACILLGFQQRKEIAAILENITTKEHSERQVKHALESLYHKFSCSSLSELINIIAANYSDGIKLTDVNIPENIQDITVK